MHRLFTDGGARGNPGPAAIGGVLYQDKKVVETFSELIGNTTNNQAEYQALIRGLELALSHEIKELNCFLDSELVVKQLNKEYKVKDKGLAKVFVRIWNLTLKFKKINFSHIPREANKLADALVNEALDKQL